VKITVMDITTKKRVLVGFSYPDPLRGLLSPRLRKCGWSWRDIGGKEREPGDEGTRAF